MTDENTSTEPLESQQEDLTQSHTPTPSTRVDDEVIVEDVADGDKTEELNQFDLFQKLTLLITNPNEFFEKTSKETNIKAAIIYFLIFGGIGILISTIIGLMSGGTEGTLNSLSDSKNTFTTILCLPFTVAAVVVIGFIFLIVISAITHFVVRLFKGEKRFEDTFRILLYVYGTTSLVSGLGNLPVIGQFIMLPLSILPILGSVYGIYVVHKLQLYKAIIAGLTPTLLVVVCFALIFLTFFSSLAGFNFS